MDHVLIKEGEVVTGRPYYNNKSYTPGNSVRDVMINETLVIFSRKWAITMALEVLLAQAYPRRSIIAVYDLTQLMSVLREHPRTPVVLGFRPHEHVAELNWLQPMLSSRAVLFVGRCFYWTDYRLPEYFGLVTYMFCSWESLHSPFSRRVELWNFIQMSVEGKDDNLPPDADEPVNPDMTETCILEKANRWLNRALTSAGLTKYEIQVLSLMSEGHNMNLPSRVRSLHKNNGLYKLGMNKHIMNLYRGVKVRSVLQTGLPLLSEDVMENSRPLRKEAGP